MVVCQQSTFHSCKSSPHFERTRGTVDMGPIQVFTAIREFGYDLYRVFVLVQTHNAMRMVNPFDIYGGLLSAVRPSCAPANDTEHLVSTWSFEQILQCWHSDKIFDSSHVNVALLGDSWLKQNIALAFTPRGTVLQSGNCCFECLVAVAKNHGLFAIYCRDGVKPLRKLLT